MGSAGPTHRVVADRKGMKNSVAGAAMKGPNPLHAAGYLPHIDGLRAIAVIAVVIFHAFPKALPGGFIGVDIFFVISGFLITTIIMRSHAAGNFSYRDFYARRVRRIFPALMLVLAATLAFGWYVLLNEEFVELGKQATGGALFVANFVFWWKAGYFDTVAETKPLLHLWSLGIEEQFYILWPLLLGVAWRRQWPIIRMLWALAAVSFLLNLLLVNSFRSAAFYFPFSRFWELIAGGILACMQLKTTAPKSWRSHGLSIAGIAMLVLGLILIRSDKAFPGWWALFPVLGAASCIAAGHNGILNKYVLSSRAMVWIGLISYPLYLWHWPLLTFARIVEGHTPSSNIRAVAVLLSVLFAWGTYRFLERSVRTYSNANALRALWVSGAVVTFVGLIVVSGSMPARNSDEQLQEVAKAALDRDYYAGFTTENIGTFPMHRIGNGARKVLLVGDSHVMQYAPRAFKLASTHPERMATTYFNTFLACPPVPGMFADGIPDCNERRDGALKLALDPQFDTVLVGGCWNCYLTGNLLPKPYRLQGGLLNNQAEVDENRSVARSLASLEGLLTELVKSKKEVYLLLDQPTSSKFSPDSMIRSGRLGKMSVTDASTAPLPLEQAKLNDQLRRIAISSGAKVIDVVANICKDGQCLKNMPDHRPAYVDAGHFRATYAREFANYLDPVFLSDGQP
jgi:peptidoglycan/LPS O-acetylase OafA/YrhL